jgi:AmmeMemoRadiSam system protein A
MEEVIPEEERLTAAERTHLLWLARQALQDAVCGNLLAPLELSCLSPRLQAPGASFVTLTHQGNLRGCIGALEPYLPLAEDVREHAVAAALQDYRFPPVLPAELPAIRIEISRLTLPRPLAYACPEDLLRLLRPGMDGVILEDGFLRATFLPQVWNKLPDPVQFLGHLCQKMGGDPDLWRFKPLNVQIYQVEEFHEN